MPIENSDRKSRRNLPHRLHPDFLRSCPSRRATPEESEHGRANSTFRYSLTSPARNICSDIRSFPALPLVQHVSASSKLLYNFCYWNMARQVRLTFFLRLEHRMAALLSVKGSSESCLAINDVLSNILVDTNFHFTPASLGRRCMGSCHDRLRPAWARES